MSTKKKGAQKEAEVHRILEEAGYTLAQPCRSIRYIPDGHGSRRPVISDQDLFGAFDRIAIRGDRPTTFVQVCSNHSDSIAERKKKIQDLNLPHTDIAIIFAWQGGGKRIDRRYTTERRYKPYQFYNLYFYIHSSNIDHVDYADPKPSLAPGWHWHGPIRMFKRVQIHNRCWACNQKLNRKGLCNHHPWADNRKVSL